MELTCKKDWPDARKRLEAFWHNEGIGRPFISVYAPNGYVAKDISMPKTFREKVLDFEYRILAEEEWIKSVYFGGEAVPCVWPDFSPDFTSACIGGDLEVAERTPDTQIMGSVWAKHVIDDWNTDLNNIEFNPESIWMKRGIEYTELAVQMGKGKYLVESLDVDGGMDTAAGLRGAEKLCMDILDCPENVGALLDRIRKGNYEVVDRLFSSVRDSQGGMVNTYKIYAPGKTYNMRSDFSYMIDPDLFRSLVLPYMVEESNSAEYIIFHTHTEDAEKNREKRLKYLDVILDIPRIHAVEWSCGGQSLETRITGMRRIIEKGKMVIAQAAASDVLEISKLLGKNDAQRVMFITYTANENDAQDLIRTLERV